MMRMVRTKLQRGLAVAAMAMAMLAGAGLQSQAADVTAAGLWQRSDKGKPVVWVLMLDRGNGLYEGIVAKTFPQPGTEATLVCDECEDDRKGQPVLGISLIRDMKRKGLEYLDGNVLDPRNGDIWSAQMKVSPDGQSLTLRGYLMTPMLGKDETWQRLPDTAYAQLDPAIAAKYPPPAPAVVPAPAPAKPGAAAPAAAKPPKPAAPTPTPTPAPAPAR